MGQLQVSVAKRMGEAVKAGCRLVCRPFMPIMPDSLANRFPFLGQVCIDGPDQMRVRFHTYGPYGKDRIAIKLARRGFWGYEGETIRVYLPLAREARTVIDIGANTGLFALLAARTNPACRVLAFEPVPFIHDMLTANIRLNQLANVEAIPAAVSDVNGETTFYVTHTNVGIPTDSSSHAGFRSNVEAIRLPTITLDEIMKQHRLTSLDLLKIDAEATEEKVIRGAIATLRQHRPCVICEVLENVDHGFVERTFDGLEYRFFHIGPEGLEQRPRLEGNLAVDQRNYLFVPAEKVAPLAAAFHGAGVSLRTR